MKYGVTETGSCRFSIHWYNSLNVHNNGWATPKMGSEMVSHWVA